MKDSKLVQQVKSELGIEVDKQIRKEIEKTKHPHADGYQLGKVYEAKANLLLKLNKMRTKTTSKILSETSEETKEKVRNNANNLINKKTNRIMNYESFKNQRNPLGNLYNVTRKSDGKEVLRGANYNSVISLIGEDKHLYEIYFY